jgi:hypothetical protein
MKLFASIFLALTLVACAAPNIKRITPESLISASSENVSFSLNNGSSLDDISKWIKEDKPAEAEVSCDTSDAICTQLKTKLRTSNIPFQMAKAPAATNSVTFIYDRVNAHDCNSYEFGCATSVNTLQMVTDHKTFVKPVLSGSQDAVRAVKSYNDSMK